MGPGAEARPRLTYDFASRWRQSTSRAVAARGILRAMAAPADPVDLPLAAALREARERIPLSQTVASVRAGLSLATLRRAELYGAASTRTLAALARVYGVTVDDLRGRRADSTGGAA